MIVAAVLTIAVLSAPVLPAPQSSQSFRARLSTVPMTVAMATTVAGSGSVTATLSGNVLTITGTFEGLKSPATTATLHHAKPGIRGPAIHELKVATTGDRMSGTITATLQLTPQEVTDLEQRNFYIQIQSEKAPAPDGNLWGWLLPRMLKR